MENSGGVEHDVDDDFTRLFIPTCDADLKPFVGQPFDSLEEAFKFYALYGYSSGFDVRKGTTKKGKHDQIRLRYFVCIREGIHSVVQDEYAGNSSTSIKRRRKASTRVSCKAPIVLRTAIEGGYVVSSFNEGHTHPLVSEELRHLLKYNRKVDHVHQMIVLKCAKANIGPVRAFRVFKELIGSYEEVGCTSVDFKNLSRELNAYADGADAQLLLDKFINKRDFGDGFKFDFLLDDCQKVKSLFWADAIGIKNYNVFGDAVSFDATYSTNRYNMIFAPFTGKDNHGCCVTFAAGLLTREDVQSYSWLLNKFVECMGVHPTMLITDQDPALKIAVGNVLPNTRHRYCMWHIMTKVAQKLPISLRDNEDFASKFYEIVWSETDEPLEFEEKWCNVINEFGLSEHDWFSDMYKKRSYWIPAFFRDLSMSGLFKTTSLSESENSFFRKYLNRNANLAAFYIHFGSAMQAQRFAYKQLCMADETTVSQLKTHIPIERHACVIYTKKIFLDVQVEIDEAVKRCCIKSMDAVNDQKMYVIDDRSNGVFHVNHHISEDTIVCSCKQFMKIGLVCRHMFVVMRNLDYKKIPEKYIISRWLKASSANLCRPAIGLHPNSYDSSDACSKSLYSEAFRCIAIAEGDRELSEGLTTKLKEWADKHSDDAGGLSAAQGKQRMFENFYGAKIPSVITVHPPDVVKNKGSGKRLKSTFEKEIEKAKKPKRRCGKCKRLAHHDSRNCGKFVEEGSEED